MNIENLTIDKIDLNTLISRTKQADVDLNGVRFTGFITGLRYIRDKEIYAKFKVTTNKQPVTFAKESKPDYTNTVLVKFELSSKELHDIFTDEVLTEYNFIQDIERPNIYNTSNIELLNKIFESVLNNTYDIYLSKIGEDSVQLEDNDFTKVVFK